MKKMILALCCIATSALHAQTVTLKFNPADGSGYDVVYTTEARMKQTIMGQPMDLSSKTTANMLYEIADAGAEKALTITYGAVKMQINLAGQEVRMDSESPDTANAANKTLRLLRGKKIRAFITTDGRVKKMEGWQGVTGALNSADEGSQAVADEVFSEATIKSLLEQGFQMYPKEPVSAGSTWSSVVRIEKPYKLALQNNYTLEKMEGGKSLIRINGKVGTNGSTKMELQGMEMEINLDGTVTGTLMMDNASGITDTFNQVLQLKGFMKVREMEVPMEGTVEIRTSMKKR